MNATICPIAKQRGVLSPLKRLPESTLPQQSPTDHRTPCSIPEATRVRLQAIADNMCVSETNALDYAVNRLHRDLTDGDIDFDCPTQEQLDEVDASDPLADDPVVESHDIRELL